MGGDYSPAGVYVAAVMAGHSEEAAHDIASVACETYAAGVREGIRQAREAIAHLSADAVEAIDNL